MGSVGPDSKKQMTMADHSTDVDVLFLPNAFHSSGHAAKEWEGTGIFFYYNDVDVIM